MAMISAAGREMQAPLIQPNVLDYSEGLKKDFYRAMYTDTESFTTKKMKQWDLESMNVVESLILKDRDFAISFAE